MVLRRSCTLERSFLVAFLLWRVFVAERLRSSCCCRALETFLASFSCYGVLWPASRCMVGYSDGR